MNARMFLYRTLSILLIALLVSPTPPVRADEVKTVSATADATLNEALSGTNDGTSTILRALSQSAGNKRNLVQFDLTSITPTAAVKTSRLKMMLTGAPQSSRQQAVHVVTSATNWNEGNVTWNDSDTGTPWGTSGGDFNGTAADTQPSGTTPNSQLTWNIRTDGTVTNIPQGWLDGSVNNRGLLVRDGTENDAGHAVINKVISGSQLMCTGSCVSTVTFSGGQSVDTSKSFLIFGLRNSPGSNQSSMEIIGELLNSTQIQFTRVGDTATVDIDWYVVEYLQGVSVQRGTVAPGFTTPVDIPLSAVPGVTSTSQMFTLLSKTPDPAGVDGQFNRDNPVIVDLTSTTNLQLRYGLPNGTATVHWQAVAFTNPADINVQRGNITTLTGANLSASAALGSAVNPAKSFVLATYQSSNVNFNGNDVGARIFRTRLTGCTSTCTSVTVERSISGSPDDFSEINYQVVTLNDGSSVQSGSTIFSSGIPPSTQAQTTATVPITTVDTTRAFAFAPTQHGGGQNTGMSSWVNNQNPGAAGFGFTFSSPSLLFIRRGFNSTAAGGDATVAWHVVEANNQIPNELRYTSREGCTVSDCPQLEVSYLRDVSYGVVTPGISEVTLNWTFPSGSTGSNYDGVLFARRLGAVAPTFTPTDGTTYTAGQQPVGGEFVVANTSSFSTLSLTDENGPDNVVTPNTQYSYKAYTHDASTISGAAVTTPPHYSFGAATTVSTLVAGGANKNWSYKTGATTLSPPGLLPGFSVVSGSNDNKLHSMSPLDGARNYQPAGSNGITGGAIQSRPPVIEGFFATNVDCDKSTGGIQTCDVAYVGAADGKAYAFNVTNGQMIWTAAVPVAGAGGTVQGAAAVQLWFVSNSGFRGSVDCDPIAPGQQTPCDLVIFGSRNTGGGSASNNRVVALNADTGSVVWTFQPGNMDIVTSTPLVDYANNVVWVTTFSNGGLQPSLWKLNSVTGTIQASFSLGDISGSPTLNRDGRVNYVLTDSGSLVAVRTDVAACTTSLAAGGSGVGFPVPSFTAANNDDIFFTTTGTVHKFHFSYTPLACTGTLTDLNGSGWTDPALTNPSGVVVIPAPLVSPAQIFVGDGTGRLLRIDAVSGAIAASRDVNLSAVIGEPGIDLALNRIYVGDTAGRIYSFDIF